MSKRLLPTTKTQVSGHRFMRRRVEHGLIFGDVRMIHDPLGSRRRAMVFGLVAVVLIAGVMGLFAWMRPNPDPGEAPILRAADGSLYVRVGEAVHPVTNLTSARLIAGVAAEPARVGDEHLAAMGRGVPVGIHTAPSMFAPDASGADAVDAWSACTVGGDTVVRAGAAPEALGEHEAVLAVADSREWLVTARGRSMLPPPTTPEGRIIRRGLSIDAATPRWSPPADVLTAVRELPPVAVPQPLPTVLRTEGGSWALTEGGIQPVSELQELFLIDAGATARDLPRTQLANYPDAEPPVDLRLPERTVAWVDPGARAVCAGPGGEGATMPSEDAVAGAVALSGTSVATHFAGLAAGSVGVDSGHGYHVVAGSGLRHRVPDVADLDIIGVQRVDEVRWQILSLLPEGDVLTRAKALTATY